MWESGFYDEKGNKVEISAVITALISKVNQLEKRIEGLEEENTKLRNIGMFDVDKDDIYEYITDVNGTDWKRSNNFTPEHKQCNIGMLLMYITNYIWNDKRASEESSRYYY